MSNQLKHPSRIMCLASWEIYSIRNLHSTELSLRQQHIQKKGDKNNEIFDTFHKKPRKYLHEFDVVLTEIGDMIGSFFSFTFGCCRRNISATAC